MAASLLQKILSPSLKNSLNCGNNVIFIRLATHRQIPTKKVENPFVQRRTNLIKQLLVALVQNERIQTTLHKAQQLKKYGDLLITLSQLSKPPPDLDMIEDGFILSESEAREKMITKKIVNRRSKKVVVLPSVLSKEEYVARCREEASNMVMGDQDVLDKLYGTLKERYQDKYGNFVRIIKIPHPALCDYPKMAYVELVDNDLEPLPDMPELSNGKRVVYKRNNEDDTEAGVAVAQR
ncbi:predicted protein [Nematostella vectensis]|uniref:Large ribosomal subunit protein bL17m n=1 Tax=Nematostella vectensis TaxID=45351 RepID=A7S6J3_NEMVE|nr:predicted protein [Nematostella vectensis]|eukprot:XP_001632696.1 predicted protein [Nematostella vectensis]